MNRIVITLAFAVFAAVSVFAQEAASYAQYQMAPILYNPGVTGFSGNHELLVNARKSAQGFAGTPVTYTAMYHGPVGDKLALGGQLFSEKIGDMLTTKIQGNYAFRFRVQKAQVGIGLTTEFINQNIDNTLLSNPLVDSGDETLEDMAGGRQIFDASVGTHILYDNRVFISLALPNTVRARLDQSVVAAPTVNDDGAFANYFFHFGYIFDGKEQGYRIIPSIAIRNFRDVPYQVDLNVQGRFLEDKLIAGLTVRPGSSGIAAFMIGSSYKGAQIMYSYDISFGPFQQYNNGSHEIMCSYAIKPRSKAKVGVTPAN